MGDEKKEDVQDIKSSAKDYEPLITIFQNKKDGSIHVSGAPDIIKASTTCSYLLGQALIALAQRHTEKGKFGINLMKGVREFQAKANMQNFRMFLGKRFKRRRF